MSLSNSFDQFPDSQPQSAPGNVERSEQIRVLTEDAKNFVALTLVGKNIVISHNPGPSGPVHGGKYNIGVKVLGEKGVQPRANETLQNHFWVQLQQADEKLLAPISSLVATPEGDEALESFFRDHSDLSDEDRTKIKDALLHMR